MIASQLRAEPIDLPPGYALMFAYGKAAAVPMPLQTIGAACRGAPELQGACARIVQTMARDADTLLELSSAAVFGTRTTAPPTLVAAARSEADAAHWTMRSLMPQYDADRPRDAEDDARLQRQVELGERRFYRRLREDAGVGDAEAAKRYVATLSKEQLARRTDVAPFVSMPRSAGW